jgi:hypothetical protein
MLQIDNTIISLDLLEDRFVCDLMACKGICCVEGDAGAPLESEEIEKLNEILPHVWDDLPEPSQKVIRKQGVFYIDDDNEPVTSIVKAYREGRVDFYKPISCHLYPVRIQKYKELTAVNVHRWNVCDCARTNGRNLNVPVYKFLKEALVRKFGAEWYEQLEIAAQELDKND